MIVIFSPRNCSPALVCDSRFSWDTILPLSKFWISNSNTDSWRKINSFYFKFILFLDVNPTENEYILSLAIKITNLWTLNMCHFWEITASVNPFFCQNFFTPHYCSFRFVLILFHFAHLWVDYNWVFSEGLLRSFISLFTIKYMLSQFFNILMDFVFYLKS